MIVPSFLTSPPEIICRVFECADDFDTVYALSRTAHVFNNIWHKHITTIFDAVTLHTFTNLAEAEQLATVQEEIESSKQFDKNQNNSKITRIKRLLFNARCALSACESWINVCKIEFYPRRGDEPHMRPSERQRFERTFYNVWRLSIMAHTPRLLPEASQYLKERNPRELYTLHEMSMWMTYYNENDSWKLDFQDETWRAGCGLISEIWQKTGLVSTYLDYTPLTFYAFFDHTQWDLEKLADHW
ncbi:hypothetical protein GLAREA_13045 [Glarea lozoyensis ATCC 20868]|uniref:F-box domain-containing protein n=1 Tax=Glarea lozoyensis (strain ATCC 20868 / MF5171) TaxID=1116229 RepID=S3CVA6_GLAL2|nr:uncharacterized protein GLAREA_13045 [Glarea lozoyensis ATCC 20868]EPE30322.1 hypothetical protein GLAREA_13045 [Glarea lozoyensis ATCC 20868]